MNVQSNALLRADIVVRCAADPCAPAMSPLHTSRSPSAGSALAGGPRGVAPAVQDPPRRRARLAGHPRRASPTAADAAAAAASRWARLKAEFDAVSAELAKATANWQAQISGLNQQKVPREQWPPNPNVAWFSRFEELAYQDQPDALRWCLGALGQIGCRCRSCSRRRTRSTRGSS
jgi:hypothetical protein